MSADLLFDRHAKVVFGVRKQVGKDVTGLRISFKIEKTLDPTPNKAEVKVYNLNENSRALAERKGLALVLSVGYGNSLEDIFAGDIVRTFSELQRADYVTTFENGDGLTGFQTGKMDASFSPGSAVKEAFRRVAASITGEGPDKVNVADVSNASFGSNMAMSGLSRKHMDDLCAREGLTWSIQDGQIQIIPKGGHTKHTGVLLSPETGLIGIPKKKNGGVDGVSLLQPKIRPGQLIVLESKFIKGTFSVQKVTHLGDTHGKDWFTNFEAIPVKGTVLNNAGAATRL